MSLQPLPQASLTTMPRWLAGFRRNALALTSELYERHGPAVEVRAPGMRFVSLFGPDAVRMSLLDREQLLSARRSWEWIMGRIFGGGLMLRDGDDHRFHRGIMQAAFKRAALEDYLARMVPQIEAEVAGWGERPQPMTAFPAYKHLTLDLAASVFLGFELGAEVARMNEAFEATVAASMSTLRLPLGFTEFGRGLAGRRYLEELFGGLIPERRAGGGADMFSRLCRAESEDGDRYSDREIVDHLVFLMMAAHDTTTSTLTSMTWLLARHPQWQEKVREECRALGEGPLDYRGLEAMEVTGRVLMETLRLYPPLSTIPRISTRPFAFEGFEVPEGAMVSVYPIHTHRMAQWWSEPDAFDPDRFADGRAEHKRHSHLWAPFGGGAHMCLGMIFAELQIKAVMHALSRRWRWSVAPGYEMPVQEAPISKPLDGLPVSLEPV